MLHWALIFLIVALIAGYFGFGGMLAAAWIAQTVFFACLALFIISLLATGGRRRPVA